jgi:hypothetical protein
MCTRSTDGVLGSRAVDEDQGDDHGLGGQWYVSADLGNYEFRERRGSLVKLSVPPE